MTDVCADEDIRGIPRDQRSDQARLLQIYFGRLVGSLSHGSYTAQ
jgi:hypothetical protein